MNQDPAIPPSGAPGTGAGGPALINWDDETMSTGVATIDEQHRELIGKINELYRVHLAGATVDDIMSILKYLGNYAKKHFQYEEDLMEKVKCPIRLTNCLAHARFLQDYQELVSGFAIDEDADRTASQIEKMAARWLASHICRVDIALREPPKEDGATPAQP